MDAQLNVNMKTYNKTFPILWGQLDTMYNYELSYQHV